MWWWSLSILTVIFALNSVPTSAQKGDGDQAEVALEKAFGEIRSRVNTAEGGDDPRQRGAILSREPPFAPPRASLDPEEGLLLPNESSTAIVSATSTTVEPITVLINPVPVRIDLPRPRSPAATNFVVRPNEPRKTHHKFEFMPHFDRDNYEFMVAEGENKGNSLMAVLTFFGRLDGQAPKFAVVQDQFHWFIVGEVTSTQDSNYVVSDVPIMLRAGANVQFTDTDSGEYRFNVEGVQGGLPKSLAKVHVEVLPVRNYTRLNAEQLAQRQQQRLAEWEKAANVTTLEPEEETTTEVMDELMGQSASGGNVSESDSRDGEEGAGEDRQSAATTREQSEGEGNSTIKFAKEEHENAEEPLEVTTFGMAEMGNGEEEGMAAESVAIMSHLIDNEEGENNAEEKGVNGTSGAGATDELDMSPEEFEMLNLDPLDHIFGTNATNMEMGASGADLTAGGGENVTSSDPTPSGEEAVREETEGEVPSVLSSNGTIGNFAIRTAFDGNAIVPSMDPSLIVVPFASLPSLRQGPIANFSVHVLSAVDRHPSKLLSSPAQLTRLELRPAGLVDIRPHFLASDDVAQLWLSDSEKVAMLAQKDAQWTLEFKVFASVVDREGNPTEGSDASVMAFAGKLTVAGRPRKAPRLSRPPNGYHFAVGENATHGAEIGRLSTEENGGGQQKQEPLAYSLLGQGAQFFRISSDGRIRLNCASEGQGEPSMPNDRLQCLDAESTPLFHLVTSVVAGGVESDSAPVTIRVLDVNDNAPIVHVFDEEMTIEVGNSILGGPFLVRVQDADIEKENRVNTVSVNGNLSELFRVTPISRDLFGIELREGSQLAEGQHTLEVSVVDAEGQRHAKTISVNVKAEIPQQGARFASDVYERSLSADKVHTGTQVAQLQLRNAPSDVVLNYVVLQGNPGWLAVEPFAGNVFVAEPSAGLPAGNYSVRVAAIDREKRQIIAECTLRVQIVGAAQRVFHFPRPLIDIAVPRREWELEETEPGEGKNSRRMVEEVELFSERGDYLQHVRMVDAEVGAWDDQGVQITVQKDSIEYLPEIGSLRLDLSVLRTTHSLHLPFVVVDEQQNVTDRALVSLTLQSFPEQILARRQRLSRPRFGSPWVNESAPIRIRIAENLPIGQSILRLAVFNPVNSSDQMSVALSGQGAAEGLFAIKPETGEILVGGQLDFERPELRLLELHLLASTPESNYTTTAVVQVELLDVDDVAPQLAVVAVNGSAETAGGGLAELSVEENAEGGTEVGLLRLRDPDSKKHQCQMLQDGAEAAAQKFALHQRSAREWMIAVGPGAELDWEAQAQFALVVRCTDAGGNSAELPVVVALRDQNDNRPLIGWAHQDEPPVRLVDNMPVGAPVTRFWARDKDSGQNAQVQFALDGPATSGEFFRIDAKTGILSVADRPLSALSAHFGSEPAELNVVARDSGRPPLQSSVKVRILVEDGTVNGTRELRMVRPAVDEDELRIEENVPSGRLISRAEALWNGAANEAEGASAIRYRIRSLDSEEDGDWVRIDERSGEVFTAREFDFETGRSHYAFLITAFSPNEPNLEANALLSVQVENVDDHLPRFPHNSNSSAQLTFVWPESVLEGERISLGKVQALDADAAPFNRTFYSIVPKCSSPHLDQLPIELDAQSGELFALANGTSLLPAQLCIWASASPAAKPSRSEMDQHPEALLNIQLLAQSTRSFPKSPEISPELLRANNSHQLLEHKLLRQTIPTPGWNAEAAQQFALNSVEFTAYGQTQLQRIGAMDALRQLVSIDETSAELRFDPAIADALADGFYRFEVASAQQQDGQRMQLHRNVHFLEDKHRLRFLFNDSVHAVGANLTRFIAQLEETLSMGKSEHQRYKVISTVPVRDEEKPRKRSSVCFHLWSPATAIVGLNDTIRLVSTNLLAKQQHSNEQLLAELYALHSVVNIEPCRPASDANSPSSSAVPSSSLLHPHSKQALFWVLSAGCLLLALFALLGYVCFVRRYAQGLRRKRGKLMAEEQSGTNSAEHTHNPYGSFANGTSSSVFSVPEFIHPRSILSGTGSNAEY